ncbi:hypothetical protein ACF0H5_012857 [Mactra antiquata]
MVSGIKSACFQMAHRFKSTRSNSRLESIREIAEDLALRSHDFFSRNEVRQNYPNVYRVRLENKWTSRKARIISFIMYAFSVSIWAIVIGLFYMYAYHPKTDKLFRRPS